MTHRVLVTVAALLFLAIVVPALLAYRAGLEDGRHQRISDLEQQLDRIATDVSLLRE